MIYEISVDFLPPVDYERFPRTDIVRPSPEDNPYNAWATKATVRSISEEATSGPLAGKRVVLKVSPCTLRILDRALTISEDNICLAGVPCEFGTNVFSDCIPTLDATVVTQILEAGGTVSFQ